jgi:hypothetical protein
MTSVTRAYIMSATPCLLSKLWKQWAASYIPVGSPHVLSALRLKKQSTANDSKLFSASLKKTKRIRKASTSYTAPD